MSSHFHEEDSVFIGGGTMGQFMRGHHWATSPLGPVSQWSPSLSKAVNLCLNSQFPIVIFWGPELRMVYNDAYLPILADKHPASLGQAAQEGWSEIWSTIGPMLRGVLENGQATWSHDLLLPIAHNATVGEHYFTFSYSPIREEDGRVCGVFCPVIETTARIQGERREHLLRVEGETARDRMAHILENMGEGHFVIDREWRIVAVNAAAAQFALRRQEELKGKNFREMFPTIRETRVGKDLQRAMDKRVAAEMEGRYALFGEWYEVRAYPLTDSGLSIFCRNITERKRVETALREREARLRTLINLVPTMVWEADSNGEMKTVSERWLAYTGFTAEQLEQNWLQLVLHPDDYDRCLAQWTQALVQGCPYEIEVRNRRYDGVYRWFLTRALPLMDARGKIMAWYGVTTDIHDRKQAEEEIRRAHDELESQVYERTIDLARANTHLRQEIVERQHAEEKLRDQDRLAAIGMTMAKLAHEIGNPLNGMSTTIQMLERALSRLSAPEPLIKESVTDLKSEIARLRALLGELRTFARPRDLNLQPTDLREVITEVLRGQATYYLGQKIVVAKFLSANLPIIMVDREKIAQLLLNLYNNAVEAMPEGGTLTIEAAVCAEGVRIEVGDCGTGIPEGLNVFEPFLTTKIQGTGLGLSIVKQLVESHKGTIEYTSSPGQGTVFTIKFPVV